MTTKSKKESTKRCLNLNRTFLLKTFQIYFLFIYLFIIKTLSGNECETNSPLKIGLIDNDYINYEYYLYYELGNFAVDKKLEFEIQKVDNNANEFDIIFGEYYDLIKLSQTKVNYPTRIKNYYSENNGRTFSNKMAIKLSEKLSALFIYTNEVSGATKTAARSSYIDNVENYGDNVIKLWEKFGKEGFNFKSVFFTIETQSINICGLKTYTQL